MTNNITPEQAAETAYFAVIERRRDQAEKKYAAELATGHWIICRQGLHLQRKPLTDYQDTNGNWMHVPWFGALYCRQCRADQLRAELAKLEQDMAR